MTKLIQVLFHGNCFDGCCSAVLFTRFQKQMDDQATFSYVPCYHVKGADYRDQLEPEATTAVVDFGFVAGADWWFDHHKSGLKAEDQALYEAQKGERFFYDPKRGSCTKFIADIARDHFGVEFPELSDLVNWAEKCDFALFADAAEATDLTHPAKVIEAVVGATKNRDLLVTVIERLQTETLATVAALPEIQAEFGPLRERHKAFFDLFR
ncbi:MAG TPA: phosphoesterase, partial [Acidobacteriota bacterium]|nr:phosphoesterase [Acidobacteriota bacterium]